MVAKTTLWPTISTKKMAKYTICRDLLSINCCHCTIRSHPTNWHGLSRSYYDLHCFRDFGQRWMTLAVQSPSRFRSR